MLRDTAAIKGNQPAIVDRDQVTTYAELCARAGGLAQVLTGLGIGRNARVAILLDRGADAAAAFFAVTALGAIAINVNETLKARQIEYILEHASASALLTTSAMLQRAGRALDSPAKIVDVSVARDFAELQPVARVGNDVAKIIYTSGSTGLPKGVTISHANLWAGMRSVTSYVQVTAQDRIASLLPFSFDYGFNQLLCCVGTGATLVVERSPLPQQIVTTLRETGVTVLPGLPPLWLQLLRVPEFRSSTITTLRAMTNTGGRIPVEGVRELRAAYPGARLFLMYGLTEAFRATYLSPESVDEHPDSIGRAIPGCEIMVLREDGTACDVGEVGELVQRGATVSLGYWRNPEATERVFRPNPLRAEGAPDSERVVYSGDLVRYDENGLLYYVGRRDKMIKTLGFRVSPDEVAQALYASGQIREGVVGSEPDEQRGERIIAYVVLAQDGSLEQLRTFSKAELPRYMQPARFEVVDVIPRTSSGKHDVEALRRELSPVPEAV